MYVHSDRCAAICRLVDPGIREGYRQRGTDPDKLLDRCIELDNAVIGNHPGVNFGIHLVPRQQPEQILCQRRI